MAVAFAVANYGTGSEAIKATPVVQQVQLRSPVSTSFWPVHVGVAAAVVATFNRRRPVRVLRSRQSEVDVQQRLREVESTMEAADEEVLPDSPELDPQVEVGRPRYAETRSLPRVLFLPEPKYRDFVANVPGDSGFDPLGLCSDVPTFVQYREAELKHGRLAMFAAVAWPLAEIVDESFAESEDATQQSFDFLAETGGKMLPQIGGENDTFVEIFAAVVLLVGGTFELFKSGQEKAPGDTGFDPLGLKGFRPPVVSTFLPENRPWMAEAELQHSRLAMMAVLYDIIVEVFTPNPVIDDTAYIFHRIDAKILRWDYWALQPQVLDIGPDVQI